jgi:hypothetical protein
MLRRLYAAPGFLLECVKDPQVISELDGINDAIRIPTKL